MMKSTQPDIIYDESGTLVSAVFYRFEVLNREDISYNFEVHNKCHIQRRNPTGAELDKANKHSWLDVVPTEGETFEEKSCCPNKSHYRRLWSRPTTVEAEGGPAISDLVPDQSGLYVIISKKFRDRIAKSQLTGLRLSKLEVTSSAFDKYDGPELYFAEFTGNYCQRLTPKWRCEEKRCPFCGYAPLICPVCNFREVNCPKCREPTTTVLDAHEGPKDKRLTIADIPKAGRILEGRQWDGCDFIAGHFITRRVLLWLQSIHAAPYAACPARVCVDGISCEQQAWLRHAITPI